MYKKTPIPVPGSDKPKHLMMKGTEGNPDYLVLARKGDVVIGLKPNAVMEGPENTTYIGARIRSASAKGVFPDEGNVHSIAAGGGDFAKPWPNILFEKSDEERASGQVCIYLDGSFKEEPQKVWDQTSEGQIGKRMAQYLKEIIEEEYLILPEAALAEYINSILDPAFQSIKDRMDRNEKMKQAVKENKGQFGMQAELMKKIYGNTAEGQAKLAHHEAEDADEEVPDFTQDGEDEKDENGDEVIGPELPNED